MVSQSHGLDPEEAINKTVEYLDRINGKGTKMTFQEYLNQNNPIRLGVGSVLLTKDEYEVSYKSADHLYIYIPLLDILYVTKTDWGILWTEDSDGNPKSRSVFRI